MSSTSEVVGLGGGSVSPNYSQQNGVYLSNNHSLKTTDNLSSVLENPFYKRLGRKHYVPSHQSNHMDEKKRLPSWGSVGDTSSANRGITADDIGEYRPGSGFVHKLLDKFSSMNAKEENLFSSSRLKRSSSLEDIIGNETASSNKTVSFQEPVSPNSKSDLAKPLTFTSQTFHKARSIEHLPQTHRRHSHHHNLAIPLRHVETSWDKENTVVPKSPRDSHVVAPDVDLARDDIIIIETTPSVTGTSKKDESSDDSDSGSGTPRLLRVSSYKEEIIPEELPKPNTVLNVRSLFESASLLSQKNVTNRPRPEPLKIFPEKTLDPQVASVQVSSPSSESNKPITITSPSVVTNDTHPTFVHFSPTSTSSASPIFSPRLKDSSNLYSPKSDDPNLTSPVVNSFAFRQKAASPQEPISPRTSLIFSNTDDEGKQKPSFRSSPSPRNTASVKPTIASKPKAPVRPAPIPFPAPASTATSYKKSSPVMPVAPFKDKADDNKDDVAPVMIFDKSKIRPAKKRQMRTKDYTPLDSEIIQTEVMKGGKRISVTSIGVRNSVKRQAPEIPKMDPVSNETPLIYSTKNNESDQIPVNKRIENITSKSNDSSVPQEADYLKSESKSSIEEKTEIVLERKSQPIRPARRNQKKEDKLSDTGTSNVTVKPQSTTISVTSNVKPASERKSNSMIYLSSSSEASENETPPETPRRVIEETSSEPVKGIPSIIAQRMRQEKTHPSQVESEVGRPSSLIDRQLKSSSTDNESSSGESEPFSPRKVLSKTPPAQNKENKEDLSNSIQNEIAAVRKRMEGRGSKGTGVAQIFDSSQLSKKRKENQQKRQTFSSQSQGIVPPLDLSSITDDKKRVVAQPKEIKPCNIVFIGANTKTGRSLLKKQRKVKVNIHFSNSLCDTFEYPSEEQALETYLADHPNEPKDEEILFLDGFGSSGGETGESTDDVETGDELPETPREQADDDILKSNTSLSSSSNLQSYRSRYQEEFVFGSSMTDPEPPQKIAKSEHVQDPEDMSLRPALEDDLDTWSTNNSSDLLF